MRLFFIRHGQADHNRLMLMNETNQHVSNLTTQGQEEASRSAQELKQEVNLDIIYCSPLMRCRQTAQIVKKEQKNPNLKIIIDERLSEFKTGFNNRSAFIWFIRLILSKNKLKKKFKGGQSIVEAAKTIENFWQEIHAEHLDENVLIVAHLHTFQMFSHYLYHKDLKLPWRQTVYLATAEVHEFKPESSK